MTPFSAEQLEAHRIGLTGFCYRMLGGAAEAEDAVQETMLRAWRAAGSYDPGRGAFSTWLYRIAANLCLDLLRGAARRTIATDLGPAANGPELGLPLPDDRWIRPMPDARVLPDDPAELAAQRESVRLAFVAALQQLPPKQRAVLILREVLGWPAAEVATLLDSSVASVNSALQRARATLRRPAPAAPLDAAHRSLLDRYVDAFQRFDIEALTALLHEDATMSMPPYPWWLRGRAAIRTALEHSDGTCHGARLLPVAVNGSPAFGQYHPHGDRYRPFALDVLDLADGRIVGMTTFLDAAGDFARFGLPVELLVAEFR
ncbi:sigma-70 family RNA polymerase sigma factor [Microlunatus parietis]|uniref:RNA polymerase sigma-70 factor (ECF subfamily) n=1 Tax=Microlunatus parietis TaxID=682979 RepID=A0A7Y9LAA4_9ACTN|nr:sigma-70 family RNA polymerase sigma factor [Microlunatus parietis]NYE72644.1 RNA polymerase sigma-70 factor (ECF subfamily) [Microlunatus parietis]